MTKNAVGEPFSLPLISGIEKDWMRGWGGVAECQNYPSKIFCLTAPEFFVGQTLRVSLLSSLAKFYAPEGYVTIFCRNSLSHSDEKFRRASF